MKAILARIYFVYAVSLFLISMTIVALIVFILKMVLSTTRFDHALHRTFQIWMGIYMPLIFCPVRHVGRERFAQDENYVVVVNHNSFLDIPVSAPGIPTTSKTLAKIEISKVPIFGYIYKQGTILVDRKNRNSRAESFAKMGEVLKAGMNLCLYPEGTRNKSNELLANFKDGAFKVAFDAKKDIIPGVIFGTKNILHPTRKMYAWPSRIEFHFLKKIKVDDSKDVASLKSETKQVMLAFIEQHKEKLV
jgi:1-acyl-sn-glycerol-3-phosphate acyltransferase